MSTLDDDQRAALDVRDANRAHTMAQLEQKLRWLEAHTMPSTTPTSMTADQTWKQHCDEVARAWMTVGMLFERVRGGAFAREADDLIDRDGQWTVGPDDEGVRRSWTSRQFRAVVEAVARTMGDLTCRTSPAEHARSVMVALVSQYGFRPAEIVPCAEFRCTCDHTPEHDREAGNNLYRRQDHGVCPEHGRWR